jgi:hypothetical protein
MLVHNLQEHVPTGLYTTIATCYLLIIMTLVMLSNQYRYNFEYTFNDYTAVSYTLFAIKKGGGYT